MGSELWWTLVWIAGYGHRLSAEVLKQNTYFLAGRLGAVSVKAPAVTSGTEFIWEWTSHDGTYRNAKIMTMYSNGRYSLSSGVEVPFVKQQKYNILMQPEFRNAGVFSFLQTKPMNVCLAQIEVFALKVKPLQWHTVNEGSDVSRSCEVSRLPESATLDWEKDRDPTSNTTLLYNNTAHIIIHSSDHLSQGKYTCALRWNGALVLSIYYSLHVDKGKFNTSETLYRGSFNSSEVVLTCRSSNKYDTAAWNWAPLLERTAMTVARAKRDKSVSVTPPKDKERFSSEGYDGNYFPLKISPIKFGDSGQYNCYSQNFLLSTRSLVTVQVSAEPPGGLSRDQSVVLTCEISEVRGSVTLAWLQMEGDRGVLVKQEVLTEQLSKRKLSHTLLRLSTEQLHWACVVFTESMLRARVPLHLTLLPETHAGQSTEKVIRIVIVLAVTVGIIAGGLWWRRPAGQLGTQESTLENCQLPTPHSTGEQGQQRVQPEQ